jgi:DNA uptake protein ComE-like DNA-binding protein
MKDKWRQFFEFSKQERIALLFFTLLMGSFLLAPRLIYEWHPPQEEEREWRQVMQSLVTDSSAIQNSGQFNDIRESGDILPSAEIRLQPFDPNQLTVMDWIHLGIPERTAHTIVRYVSKGGRFRRAADLYKIWGIRKTDVQRLLPYVSIPADLHNRSFEPTESMREPPKQMQQGMIDVNQADSVEWTRLPGIGPVFARRIVRFREMMGGFHSLGDLRRVYGLSDTVYLQILPFLRISPRPLDTAMLNHFSPRQLMARLQINYETAQAIVAYRKQMGRFLQVEDLKKLIFIPDSLYQRIAGKTRKSD